jgi:hypothetical protein
VIQITGFKNIKSAIISLYYSDKKEQKEFISNLDKDTLSNFSILFGVIKKVIPKSSR